jgi:hypothetical protein
MNRRLRILPDDSEVESARRKIYGMMRELRGQWEEYGFSSKAEVKKYFGHLFEKMKCPDYLDINSTEELLERFPVEEFRKNPVGLDLA